MRVVIVEDEYLIAMDIETTLTAAGCDVVGIAGTVDEALQVIAEKRCDAAILDTNLNRVSSEPVAAALRQGGIPFLILSGYRNDQRAGAFVGAPSLTKPCKPEALVEAVLALRG